MNYMKQKELEQQIAQMKKRFRRWLTIFLTVFTIAFITCIYLVYSLIHQSKQVQVRHNEMPGNNNVALKYEFGIIKHRMRQIAFQTFTMEQKHVGGSKYQALWREFDSLTCVRDSIDQLFKKCKKKNQE